MDPDVDRALLVPQLGRPVHEPLPACARPHPPQPAAGRLGSRLGQEWKMGERCGLRWARGAASLEVGVSTWEDAQWTSLLLWRVGAVAG